MMKVIHHTWCSDRTTGDGIDVLAGGLGDDVLNGGGGSAYFSLNR